MHANVFARKDHSIGLVANAFDDLDRNETRGKLAASLELEVLD